MKLVPLALAILAALPALAYAAPNAKADTLVMTSDPQYPCVVNCEIPTAEQSEKNIRDQYAWINANYKDAAAVVVNGDLTEYSHADEVAKSDELLQLLKEPVFIGLGNHDYLNNKDDTYQNNAAIRGIVRLINHVAELKKHYPVNADIIDQKGYAFPTELETISGSLSYAVDLGNIYLIQLNDNPYDGVDSGADDHAYPLNSYTDAYVADLGMKRYKINLSSSLAWLNDRLEYAAQQGKVVVVNRHSPDINSDTKNLLNKYNVQFRFAGHYHWELGQDNGFQEDGSSAAMQSAVVLKLNTAKHTYEQSIVCLDRETCGYHDPVKTTTGTYTLTKPRYYQLINHPGTNPGANRVSIQNEGGYTGVAQIHYIDKLGKAVNLSSGKMALGNIYSVDIPQDAEDIKVSFTNDTWILCRAIQR